MKIMIATESRYPVDRKRLRLTAQKLLKVRGVNKDESVQVDIYFVGDRKMKALNKQYLKKDKTTDVLSFPLSASSPDGVFRLGEVVISYPQARKQAMKGNILIDEEIDRLVEHGMLHLLGIHH